MEKKNSKYFRNLEKRNYTYKYIKKIITENNIVIAKPKDHFKRTSKALSELKNDKSPRLDGFLKNFYKIFWEELKYTLWESCHYSFDNGELPISLRTGMINLIPKEDKDHRFLKSWRPVSLLNTDYKTLTKALANKLQKVIPKIVNTDLVRYIRGRHIGENIRIIEDLIKR